LPPSALARLTPQDIWGAKLGRFQGGGTPSQKSHRGMKDALEAVVFLDERGWSG